jgi:hypothetical protein
VEGSGELLLLLLLLVVVLALVVVVGAGVHYVSHVYHLKASLSTSNTVQAQVHYTTYT